MSLLRMTRSICPKCHKIIDAQVVEDDSKVWLEKSCGVHGSFREIYWSDAKMYKWAEEYSHDGSGVTNPRIKIEPSKVACPYNCGLCTAHKSHTILANIFVTNRCNKRCWYCFAGADNIRKNGFVYEPSFDEIKKMLQVLRESKPVPVQAVQFTGGEPTIRQDMPDIVREAVNLGFKHIQLNTNGIAFALDADLPKTYRDAGVNVAYMSFDGTTPQTNPKNHKYIRKIIENCRNAGLPVTLVPTVINGINDSEIWPVVKFALENIDIVRSVNFQPVSFVGAMSALDDDARKKRRITIPDILQKLEKQSGGIIPGLAFYPIPCVLPVSRVVSKTLGGAPVPEFTCESHCGTATYIFRDGEKIIPISGFLDVDAFFRILNEVASGDIETRVGQAKAIAKLYVRLSSIVKKENAPKNFDLAAVLIDILTKKKNALERFHWDSLMVGAMHFMDPYNYDVERVKRCIIHYVVPDGRIIPFCAFNALPEIYREKIIRDFGVPVAEWELQMGRKIEDDILTL